MTVHGTELVFISAAIALGFILVYALAVRRMKQDALERQLNIADHLAKLDEAIRAVETRLAEQHALLQGSVLHAAAAGKPEAESGGEDVAEVPPEIQAAIAAAAVTVAGPNAQVRSIQASAPAASAWTQQGRVMVQGGHNLRVRQ